MAFRGLTRRRASKAYLLFASIALLGSLTATAAQAVTKKSISNWVNCGGGGADDTTGATTAFAAAAHNAFTLVIDCQVHLHSGNAIDRGIFIDSGTTVEFTSAGKFFVDNFFHPAFVIASSNNIHLSNWNVEWDGSVPVNPNFGGYTLAGTAITVATGRTQPAGSFSDIVLSEWLTDHRSVQYDYTAGWVRAIYVGGINPAAIFFLTGDTYNVSFTGIKLYTPANLSGDHFMPMAFSFSPNWVGNQTVRQNTPRTPKHVRIPHNLTFSGIDLDGTLMGFQGNLSDTLFEDIVSHRYGDLQDAHGNYSGGVGKWFPPPHLFYLNYNFTGDPGLANSNLHFETVSDLGPRIGVARDKGGSDNHSGYASSLKLGCNDCTVNNYISDRPDGFLDLLTSDSLRITNVTATFDSHFLNEVYPPGVRFPLTGYTNFSMSHVTLNDTADNTLQGAIGHATMTTNDNWDFNYVNVNMKRWAGSNLPLPSIGGKNLDVALNFNMHDQSRKVNHLQTDKVDAHLEAQPITIKRGGSTLLSWGSHYASSCQATDSWSGTVQPASTRWVKLTTAGTHLFTLRCASGSAVSKVTVAVITQ